VLGDVAPVELGRLLGVAVGKQLARAVAQYVVELVLRARARELRSPSHTHLFETGALGCA
jgi:hypothetical protein